MTRLLLIDTNLLVVAVVAAVDPKQVERVGRTRGYSEADAVLLNGVIAGHDGILVTPHVLTEVSNLLGKIDNPLRSEIRVRIAALVPSWVERVESSSDLVADPFFHRFGITDAAIARSCAANITVLTDDLPLFDALGRQGQQVINFTHVRSDSWREAIEWQ